jgi:hypothetical protein
MKIKSKSGAVLGALIAAALVSASAASLGGLTSETLGAESEVVAGCDTDGIDIAYDTAYDTTSQNYEVVGVRLLGVDDLCTGQLVSVALDDGTPGGSVLAEESQLIITLADVDTVDQGTDTDLTDDFYVAFAPTVDAVDVLNISIVIA